MTDWTGLSPIGTFSVGASFYLPPGLPEGIIICTMCVRAWVTQFSLKLLQLHIFGKLQVLIYFYALQYFFGDLWPTFE